MFLLIWRFLSVVLEGAVILVALGTFTFLAPAWMSALGVGLLVWLGCRSAWGKANDFRRVVWPGYDIGRVAARSSALDWLRSGQLERDWAGVVRPIRRRDVDSLGVLDDRGGGSRTESVQGGDLALEDEPAGLSDEDLTRIRERLLNGASS
jgi:hypothetical protein